MPYCAVFGCNSSSRYHKDLSWFIFPKERARGKSWIRYCKRADFVPTKHSKICSKHFSASQYARHLEKLAELGYPEARPTLKEEAVPDITITEEKNDSSPIGQKQDRPAFEKRRKREVSIKV